MREQFIATGKQSATISESMRAQARLFRNLGDNMTAEKWETQAQLEENHEKAMREAMNLDRERIQDGGYKLLSLNH